MQGELSKLAGMLANLVSLMETRLWMSVRVFSEPVNGEGKKLILNEDDIVPQTGVLD